MNAESRMNWDILTTEFRHHLKIEPPSDVRSKEKIEDILKKLEGCVPASATERQVRLFALVNRKFEINASAVAAVFGLAAKNKISFNYHEKTRIEAAFDRADHGAFIDILRAKDVASDGLENAFKPAPHYETLKRLHAELASPTLVRKDSRPRDWSREIIRSIFGGFVFAAFREQDMHELFDKDLHAGATYEQNFWTHLHKSRKELFSRSRTLVYFEVSQFVSAEQVAEAFAAEYDRLANHGYFALHLKSSGNEKWAMAGRVTLFAEKFRRQNISNGYFRWEKIKEETSSHVPNMDATSAEFDFANLGYHYKDNFVFDNDCSEALLLFQKNEPDETIIPCPACRSHDVQGNSYSSLGVKSWECTNPICPDRSKFDRGKRYSFYQLLKQQAIENSDARIPGPFVRRWARDVQTRTSSEEIIEMLLRHYTLPGDGVLQIGGPDVPSLGRKITYIDSQSYLRDNVCHVSALNKFLASPFFNRFAICRNTKASATGNTIRKDYVGIQTFLGDCFEILQEIPDETFDGAVTSPPYYNAREYSQWSNIYTYLFDMFNAASQVFRTLKPGAIYLFNIFDYFDNENTVVHSAMGDKRLILSAYCVELFERVGFRCEGNIVWDKGEIEGKRAFNNGNFSPYYQAPFNCWEHVLIFKKPGDVVNLSKPLPAKLSQKPVFKIVRGENRHGHTAPFPDQIPALLIERLVPGAIVLDPYAGSMTTGRVAANLGRRAVCIEKDRKYFDLGCRVIETALSQPSLFSRAAS